MTFFSVCVRVESKAAVSDGRFKVRFRVDGIAGSNVYLRACVYLAPGVMSATKICNFLIMKTWDVLCALEPAVPST